jgi:HPt (histidine-containing phosphotransfer) domain-containing protein
VSVQEQLRQLVHAHHSNFAKQLVSVERLLHSGDETGLVPAEQIADAQALSHQMKGTAGSMGFPIVGQAAAELDDILKGLKAEAVPVDATRMQAAREQLAKLQSIAAQTTPEMSTLYHADLSKLGA